MTRKREDDFFLKEAGVADGSPVGRQLAERMVMEAKARFPEMTNPGLMGYLYAWNCRSGSPFSWDELLALAILPPREKVRRVRAKDKPRPNEPLFGEEWT